MNDSRLRHIPDIHHLTERRRGGTGDILTEYEYKNLQVNADDTMATIISVNANMAIKMLAAAPGELY